MKKLFVGLLLLLVLVIGALVAVTYWFGMQAETIYKNQLFELNEKGELLVLNQQYQRGWFTSRSVDTFKHASQPVEFQALSRIQHGPFPVNEWTQRIRSLDFSQGTDLAQAIVESSVTVKIGAKQISLPNPLTINAVIDRRGGVAGDFQMLASSVQPEAGVNFSWQDSGGNFRVEPGGEIFAGTVDVPVVTARQKGTTIVLKNFGSQFDMRSTKLGLLAGKASIGIDRLAVKSPDDKDFSMVFKELRFSSVTSFRKNRASYATEGRFKKFELPEVAYGPGEFSLKLTGLDAKEIAKWQKKYQKKLQEADAGSDADMMPTAMALLDLLGKGETTLDTRLNVETDTGPVKGQAIIKLDADGKDVAKNPFAMLAALDMTAEIDLPAAILDTLTAQEVERQLAGLEAQGKLPEMTDEQHRLVVKRAISKRINQRLDRNELIKKDDGSFRIKVVYRDGNLLMNGQPYRLFGGQ